MENQGQRIKKIRKSLDLTLEKFGDRLGVTSVTISRLENSNRNLTKQMTKAICREYNVDYTWLTTGEGDMFISYNNMDLMMPGDRIKYFRTSCLNLSLEKFARNLNVTSMAISNIENNNRNLTKRMAMEICKEYNVNYDWLIYGEGDMFKDTSLIERLETFLINDFDGSFTALFDAILNLNDSERQALSVLIQKIRKD